MFKKSSTYMSCITGSFDRYRLSLFKTTHKRALYWSHKSRYLHADKQLTVCVISNKV